METSGRRHFASLTDPRSDRATEHRLLDIITIVLCAVVCGADDWVTIETFGRAKATWLRGFWRCPVGFLRLKPSARCAPAGPHRIPRLLRGLGRRGDRCGADRRVSCGRHGQTLRAGRMIASGARPPCTWSVLGPGERPSAGPGGQ